MKVGGTKTIKASFQIKFEKGLGYMQSPKSHDTSLCNGYIFGNASNYILSAKKASLLFHPENSFFPKIHSGAEVCTIYIVLYHRKTVHFSRKGMIPVYNQLFKDINIF